MSKKINRFNRQKDIFDILMKNSEPAPLYRQIASQILEIGEGEVELKIPSIRQLADLLKVAPLTVSKSLNFLYRRGAIDLGPGQRPRYYFKHPMGGDESKSNFEGKFVRADALSTQIKSELLQGRITGGRISNKLPDIKTLSHYFRRSDRTIRKALLELEKVGFCKKVGRSYQLSLGSDIKQKSFVCITGHPHLLQQSDSSFEFAKSLENEVFQLGWERPEFILAKQKIESNPPSHKVSALIHFGEWNVKPWSHFFNRRKRIPLVLIDLNESFQGVMRENCLHLRVDNYEAGREIGRQLAQRGHQNVAWFSPFEAGLHHWEGKRMKGLRSFVNVDEFRPKKPLQSLRPRGLKANQIRKQFAQTKLFPKELLSENLNPFYEMFYQKEWAEALKDEFVRAYQSDHCSAWLGVNDVVASLAHHFLKKRDDGAGCKQSQNISIIGFDNSSLSYRMGIASYDFAPTKFSQLALKWMSTPSLLKKDGKGNSSMAVQGNFIPRASLKKA